MHVIRYKFKLLNKVARILKMSTPLVKINQGELRGKITEDINGSKFYSFQGIPYAKPPLGKLRFKAPQPPENWKGIFDATKEGNSCCFRDVMQKGILVGSENCLFINAFTKTLPTNGKSPSLPVMVWIHGGAFMWGSSEKMWYGPEFLLTEEIVLVTFNYRLGLLGFLNFKDPSLGVPGNAGLKDMVMALKWVQENIAKFGGDPNNVTIFGESAGSLSVHLLMLSPKSHGLFHKAIAQSGSALVYWCEGRLSSDILADIMGLQKTEEQAMLNKLMDISFEEVLSIQDKIDQTVVFNMKKPISFVIEPEGPDAFLSRDPIELILSGKFNHVPLIIGYNTAEGLMYEMLRKPTDPDDPSFETKVPWQLGYEIGTLPSKEIASKIRTFYFGDGESSRGECMMHTDLMFLYGIYVAAVNHSLVSSCPVYFYRMSVETCLNFLKILLGIKDPGAAHGDDIGYLFKNITTPVIQHGSLEEISMKRFVKLWTNFAKFGKPIPTTNDPLLNVIWEPITEKAVNCLDIGESLVPLVNPDIDRVQFWDNLYLNSPSGSKITCIKFP